MSNLQNFKEMLIEAQQPDFRTPEMINESANNARKWIDEKFISITKFTINDFNKYSGMAANNKKLITTDGKWVITISRKHELTFRVSDSSNFYKNGTSKSFSFYGDDDLITKSFTKHFTDTNGDLIKTCEAMVKELGNHIGVELTEKNRDPSKFNPYSLSGIKPYSKALPNTTDRDELRATKLTRDDVSKMIMSGQILGAKIGRRLTDDYAFDAATNASSGQVVNPIDILTDDLLGEGNKNTYVKFDVTKEGDLYVTVSPYMNLVYNLQLDKSKFKK